MPNIPVALPTTYVTSFSGHTYTVSSHCSPTEFLDHSPYADYDISFQYFSLCPKYDHILILCM
jgi:hypothetical protein